MTSPPAPNHVQTAARLIANQGGVPAPSDTPYDNSIEADHLADWMRVNSSKNNFLLQFCAKPDKVFFICSRGVRWLKNDLAAQNQQAESSMSLGNISQCIKRR